MLRGAKHCLQLAVYSVSQRVRVRGPLRKNFVGGYVSTIARRVGECRLMSTVYIVDCIFGSIHL